MPIKVELSFGEQSIALPDIEPQGPPTTLSHLDPNKPQIIIVSCNPDDQGGFVYTYDADKSFVIPEHILSGMTEGATMDAVIAPFERYQRDIRTKFGLGTLILAHFER